MLPRKCKNIRLVLRQLLCSLPLGEVLKKHRCVSYSGVPPHSSFHQPSFPSPPAPVVPAAKNFDRTSFLLAAPPPLFFGSVVASASACSNATPRFFAQSFTCVIRDCIYCKQASNIQNPSIVATALSHLRTSKILLADVAEIDSRMNLTTRSVCRLRGCCWRTMRKRKKQSLVNLPGTIRFFATFSCESTQLFMCYRVIKRKKKKNQSCKKKNHIVSICNLLPEVCVAH